MGQSTSDTMYKATTRREIKSKLEEYGICYIPNVLDSSEIMDMICGTWDYFEHVTELDDIPVKIGDPKTWSSIQLLEPTKGMMFNKYNAGHSQHMWNLRQNNNICKIWANLLGCKIEDLLVSFDGFSFLLPPEQTHDHWHNEKEQWYHVDQRLSIHEQDGYQSFVTAYDIGEDDATLTFLEGSHLLTKKFTNKFDCNKNSDWYQFNEEEMKWWKSKCLEREITCPAGSLVIWDSRLVHYGRKPKRCRMHKNTKCIAYLSYSNKSRDPTIIDKKIIGFNSMLTSNHYAHRASFFNQGNLDSINKINLPILSELGYSLVGFTEDDIIRMKE